MIEIKSCLAAITVIETTGSPELMAVRAAFSEDKHTAMAAYARLCGLLLRSGRSMSSAVHDYILEQHDLISGLGGDERLKKAFAFDLDLLREICGFVSGGMRQELFARFGDELILRFPAFLCEEFSFDVDYFTSVNKGGIFARYSRFVLKNGKIVPVKNPDIIRLCDLREYTHQQAQLLRNTKALVCGLPAQNALLYGDRGTGKSSTVKAMPHELPALRLIQVDKHEIAHIPALYDELGALPYPFVLFLDDLTFGEGDSMVSLLKRILEGGIAAKPHNIAIYATTNLRHVVKEAERDRTSFHKGDEVDDAASLADRFGLYLTFTLPDKALYLEIVRQLADEASLTISPGELERRAESYALKKGGRSPRAARQLVELLAAEGLA